jgi:hypothetical protein
MNRGKVIKYVPDPDIRQRMKKSTNRQIFKPLFDNMLDNLLMIIDEKR